MPRLNGWVLYKNLMIKKEISYSSANRVMLLVLVCFFLSGLTSLIYEILWTRMIVKIIGAAPFAVSIVLTVFMAGLGLGSLLAARTIDRIAQPIRLVKIYGVLELIIGLYALAVPLLLTIFEPIYAVIYNRLFSQFMLYNLLTFVGCSVILLIPVICMGATLPVLCRFYVTELSHLGTCAGRLYGLNTIGAAAGSLLCGFWLIELLGVWGTLIFAVLVNCLIGLSCILAGRKLERRQEYRVAGTSRESPLEGAAARDELAGYPAIVTAAMVIFAVSGFCSMAYEVIWTRLLGLIVGPTTYSFTIVLVTFILGLALGSMFFGYLADRTGRAVWLLVCTQAGAALFALGVSQLLGGSQLFFAKLLFSFKDHFVLLNLAKTVTLFLFMILPTFCLGATFPLVGKIYTQSMSRLGWSIGFAYTINTAGAVLGSFCAGFVLIPLLGKEKSLSIVIALQLLASLITTGIIMSKQKNPLKWLLPAAPALAGLVLCFYFPRWDHRTFSEGKYHRFDQIGLDIKTVGWLKSFFEGPKILSNYKKGELVYYGDGIGGFTTVAKFVSPLGNIDYSMMNSGKSDASTRGDMITQTLLAHFPMLFHHNPKTVMVLGLASGITAGEVLNYPVERLDVIEISPQVVEASKFFVPWNNNVLANPKTNLIIQDGRAHLQLTSRKYDVIISEPSNPWMVGLAALFTSDFFELAKNSLNEDGMFVQWFHSYQLDWQTFALVGRTFAEVFPNSILVQISPSGVGNDYLFVGFNGEHKLSLENARRNLTYAQLSPNVTINDPRLFYLLIFSEDLPKFFGEGFIDTDNRPRLEFAAPKLMYHRDTEITKNVLTKRWLSPQSRDIVTHIAADIDAQINLAVYALSVYSPFPNMVDTTKATPAQKERYFKLMEDYYSNNPIENSSVFKNSELKKRCISAQINAVRTNIDRLPDKPTSYSYLALLYYGEGMLDEAVANLTKSLQLKPDDAQNHYNLGLALETQGKIDDAVSQYNQALQLNPNDTRARYNLGNIFQSQGKFDKAISQYRQVLQITPDDEKAHNNIALALYSQGKLDEAVYHYHRALQIKPDFFEANYNLGSILSSQGKTDEAINCLREALRLNPNDAEVHNNLAVILLEQGKLNEAIDLFRQALKLKPDYAEPMYKLAEILATNPDPKVRDANQAIALAERAADLTRHQDMTILEILANAYAAGGQFDKAVTITETALNLASTAQNNEQAARIRSQLEFYKQSKH